MGVRVLIMEVSLPGRRNESPEGPAELLYADSVASSNCTAGLIKAYLVGAVQDYRRSQVHPKQEFTSDPICSLTKRHCKEDWGKLSNLCATRCKI